MNNNKFVEKLLAGGGGLVQKSLYPEITNLVITIFINLLFTWQDTEESHDDKSWIIILLRRQIIW